MSLTTFTIAVLVSGPLRAAMYSVLGSSIVELDWRITLALGVGFLVAALLPLAFPSVRARLLGRGASG